MSDANVVRAMTKPVQGAGRSWGLLVAVAVLVAGCAGAPKPEPRQADEPAACPAASEGDAWVGNWLGVNQHKGVAGELHVQITLHQDGTMAYTEQLKRTGKSPQSLNEIGCWHREGDTLVLRTTHSNAVAVEQGDPIYTNEYETQTQAGRLVLQGPEGPLSFRKMPDDYRLPLF